MDSLHLEPRRRWDRKLAEARAAVIARQSIRKDMIEVAAQHPLVDGIAPGEEFTARVGLAVELCWRDRSTA